MDAKFLIAIMILAPLAGFIFNGIGFKKNNIKVAGAVGTSVVALSFLCALTLFIKLTNLAPESRVFLVHFFDWIEVGGFSANASFSIDAISIIMALIITGVGSLIHLFSIGYMFHDDRPAKYFAYLNFFIFNMLLLVLGSNLLVMFVGWEGVGLSSYLLIGFWFTDKEKAAAGMKAFITNRIGDAGFLLGIFTLYTAFGTIEFSELNALANGPAETGWSGPLTLACLFLFVGACGKSAQIPLHVWLPDAMAGPTPVSALIHAATMVTAGVYMIVRLSPIFLMAPNALHVIALVGALTAMLGATIGLTQWDIKKVLAYSTVSQLGFMFLAVGVGAFTAGFFHLMTHAFFKALMFLGSGSVIHAMDDEQDMRKMGGLKSLMPVTYWTFFCGWVAIIGLPPFSGFFSKDEILWLSFHSPLGHWSLWIIGAMAALCTSFYMTRLMCLTFWGKSRVPKETKPHESPTSMLIPLIVLAVFSVFAGWLGVPHIIGSALGHMPHVIENWLSIAVKSPALAPANHTVELLLMAFSVLGAAAAVYAAKFFYLDKPETPEEVARASGKVYEIVKNKYYFDEVYRFRIIDPILRISEALWIFIDKQLIDRMTYLAADVAKGAGSGFRSLQNGNIQNYASYILFGLVALVLYVLLKVGA